jgi:conjugative transfer pilus assembly protein TraH
MLEVKFKLLFVLAAIFIFLSSGSAAKADWVNDWVQQKTSVTPNYFQGQKRGYMSGGSYSARWYGANTWSPVTLSPPAINPGCGGIDIFGGGFSFVNPEYLVQQLQSLLQAAPAVAFDLALNTLCSPCSKAIKSIQAITDRLNGLQLDNCLLTKALVVKALNPLSPSRMAAENTKADQTFQTLTGSVSMFTDIFRQERGDPSGGTGQPAKAQTSYQDMIAACPQDIKDIYGTGNTNLLDQAASKAGFSQDYVDLMRGLTGDLRFSAVDNGGKLQLVVTYISPCKENKSSSIEDFFSGKVKKKNSGGVCAQATAINLSEWSQNKMVSIASKIKNKAGNLTPEEESIIKTSPVPVYSAIKAAVVSDQVAPTVALLADVTARAYAFGSMSDLYSKAVHLLYYARDVSQKQGQSVKPACQIQILEPGMEAINKFISTVYQRQQDIKMDYARVAEEINTIQSLVGNYRTSNNIITAGLVKNINGSAVGKVTKQ